MEHDHQPGVLILAAVFGVFLTLEVTEILLFLGFFAGQAAGDGLVMVGGWVGVLTALVAWYASAAGVANAMTERPVVPVGRPIWTMPTGTTRAGSPMPRIEAAGVADELIRRRRSPPG